MGQPGGQPVRVHPREQLLVEGVDVADGLLQDVGLENQRKVAVRLNPFGDIGVTDPVGRPKSDTGSKWQSALLFHGGGESPPIFRAAARGPLCRRVKRAKEETEQHGTDFAAAAAGSVVVRSVSRFSSAVLRGK